MAAAAAVVVVVPVAATAQVDTESCDELSDRPTGDGVREKLVISCVGRPLPKPSCISTITTGVTGLALRFNVTVRLHTVAAAGTPAAGLWSSALSDSVDAYVLQPPGPAVPSDSNTHERP